MTESSIDLENTPTGVRRDNTPASQRIKDFNPEITTNGNLEFASFYKNPERPPMAEKELFEQLAKEAIEKRGKFVVSLCGGRSPNPLYEALKTSSLDWSKVHFFWGDERPPRPDVGQTNFETAEEFLKEINIPLENVHQIRIEGDDRQKVAADYEAEINAILGESLSFDLMILGGGGKDQMDGHTMGLMKNSEVFSKTPPNLVEVISRDDTGYGYTMTPELIRNAKQIMVLLPGVEKVDTAKRLKKGKEQPPQFPIGVLNKEAAGKTIVFTDQQI